MLLWEIVKRLEEIRDRRGDVEVRSVKGCEGSIDQPVDTIRFDSENKTLIFTNGLPF